jgi:peptide/nickel transport system permease protein
VSVRAITARPRAEAVGSAAIRGFVAGVVTMTLGCVALWLALAPLGRLPGLVKVPAVAFSLVAMYQGYRRVGQAVWGPRWDAMFWLSCTWLVLLIAGAALADVLPLAEHVDITKTITEPGNARPDLLSRHPLGTNNFSLDVLARSLYGARVSLLTATFAVVFALVVGGSLGIAAGYLRGSFNHVVGVATDSMLAFPSLVFLVALAAVLGTPDSALEAVPKTGIALGLVSLPIMIRLARANTLAAAQSDYVTASKVLGATKPRIMFGDIAPNVALPLLSYSFVLVAVMIVAEGALAFLGLGLQQPNPSWGNMIAEGGLATLTDYPHIPLVPGAFMFVTVLSLNLVGERAMARWNPRESNL